MLTRVIETGLRVGDGVAVRDDDLPPEQQIGPDPHRLDPTGWILPPARVAPVRVAVCGKQSPRDLLTRVGTDAAAVFTTERLPQKYAITSLWDKQG